MVSTTLKLTDQNRQKLEDLARRTGKTADQLANEAIEHLPDSEEASAFTRWRESLLKLEGMWKDRDDLPDFEALRRSWDRDPGRR